LHKKTCTKIVVQQMEENIVSHLIITLPTWDCLSVNQVNTASQVNQLPVKADQQSSHVNGATIKTICGLT